MEHNLEDDTGDQIFYTRQDLLSQCMHRIPSFLGKRIRGCFYGWMILSNRPHDDKWSLWNPVTSKIIHLPCLIPKNGDQGFNLTGHFCLSAPPDDHGSVFMLTTKKQTLVFCRLDCKRKKLKWVEMVYAKQMRSKMGWNGFLRCLTCCDGEVYALYTGRPGIFVIHIDIVVMGREIVISLSPYLKVPSHYINNGCMTCIPFLKGHCTELFYIELGLNEVGNVTKETVGSVFVFRLDMKNMRWERMEDLKDAAFFLDAFSVFYIPAFASELRGHVHFLDGKVLNSCNLKNKTIALSFMPTRHASSSECRLQGDHGEIKSQQEEIREKEMTDEVDGNGTRIGEDMEPRLFNIPCDILKTIMQFCVGVEYLNFRATCKRCHLAAPVVQWSKGGRLQTYSLVSPWLMVLDKDRGVISFTDPVFGDRYFKKTPQELIGDLEIHCCIFGWLLIRRRLGPLMFFNPFTSDIRELPSVPYLHSYCFSAPPTSSDCMVVGFTRHLEWRVYIHFVARDTSWRRFRLNFYGDDLRPFYFTTIYRQSLYALHNNGGLYNLIARHNNEGYTCLEVLSEGPGSSCCGSVKQNFLVKCDQQLLLVIFGEFGEPVEVFKLNDSTEWEKIESLGRHMIFIGGSCLCIEAKTTAMANRIYFPRVRSKNGKIVFYSLVTRSYHTSDTEENFVDFMGTKHHLDPHVWIEPTWS